MNKFKVFFLTTLLLFIFTGCSDDYRADISCNCVELEENGSVDAIIVEDFGEAYYSENELITMVNEEVNAFNASATSGTMSVKDHSVKEGILSLALNFSNTDAYNQYMPDSVFIGTLKDAYDAGMDFNRSLWVVGKGETTIGKNDLLKMENSKLIVVDGPYMVRCPSQIKYYSQGMYILDENTVVSDSEGQFFVIYK